MKKLAKIISTYLKIIVTIKKRCDILYLGGDASYLFWIKIYVVTILIIGKEVKFERFKRRKN